MNTTPIHFDADITLADLADAVAAIGCRLEVGDRAEIRVTRPAMTFEPVEEALPVIGVEDLEYDLPQWLRRQAD
jgi:hypothetical protein